MQTSRQKTFQNVFLKIINDPGLTPLMQPLEVVKELDCTFIEFTQNIFDILIEGRGTHLSVHELRAALDCEVDIASRIFNAINVKSKNIDFSEFHDFIAKGTIDYLLELDGAIQEISEDENDTLIHEEYEKDTNCWERFVKNFSFDLTIVRPIYRPVVT